MRSGKDGLTTDFKWDSAIDVFNGTESEFYNRVWGEADEDAGVDTIVQEALNHPLLNVDYTGANGALVHITGGPNMSLKYVQDVAKTLTQDMDCYSNVILGARVVPEFEGKCRVMAIMTGVQSPNLLSAHGLRESQPLEAKKVLTSSKVDIDFVR